MHGGGIIIFQRGLTFLRQKWLHFLIIEGFEHPVFIIAFDGGGDRLRGMAGLKQLVVGGIPAFEGCGIAEHLLILFIQVFLVGFFITVRFQRNV